MKGGARRNKPAALRTLHGSKTRARHRRVVVVSPVDALAPPPGLTPMELELWGYYAPLLARVRMLTEGDRETLAHHVIGLAQVRAIRGQQQAPTYRRLTGKRTHPLDSQLRHWLQLTRLSAAELGLSPVSRARVMPAGPVEERDALEDFIATPIHRVK